MNTKTFLFQNTQLTLHSMPINKSVGQLSNVVQFFAILDDTNKKTEKQVMLKYQPDSCKMNFACKIYVLCNALLSSDQRNAAGKCNERDLPCHVRCKNSYCATRVGSLIHLSDFNKIWYKRYLFLMQFWKVFIFSQNSEI